MAKGFKDSKGNFRPTGNKGVSSRDKSTKPMGLKFKPTSIRKEKIESEDLDRLLRELKDTKKFDLNIDPKTFLKAVQNDPNWTPAFGADSMKNIKKRIENGESIDKPFLFIIRYTKFKPKIIAHQGRHRAVTARELGLKEIPVEVYCTKGSVFAKCNNVTESDLINALSQFPNRKEVKEDLKRIDRKNDQLKRDVKRIEKVKNKRPDEEQFVFEGKWEIKENDQSKKLGDEMVKKREKKRKQIENIFK